MKMKHLLAAAALAATSGPLFAGGEGWTHDFEAAQKQAADENKSLLIDFTGSDWCGWCIKLNEEVFQHEPFKEGVKEDFVLVELDYPRDKSGLSEETQKQNERLQEKYGIRGFPTILLTDAEGKPFAQTGYQQGGPEKYVEHLDELLKARETRDEAFAKAKELEGEKKAEALVGALQAMALEDAMVASFYGDVVEEIKAADPDDTTGFVKEMEMKEKFASFQEELNGFAREQDHEGALAYVDKTLSSGEFEGETKQQIAFFKGAILAQMQKFDEALTALDEAKAIAPESEMAGRLDQMKAQLEQMKAQAESQGEEATEEAPAE